MDLIKSISFIFAFEDFTAAIIVLIQSVLKHLEDVV